MVSKKNLILVTVALIGCFVSPSMYAMNHRRKPVSRTTRKNRSDFKGKSSKTTQKRTLVRRRPAQQTGRRVVLVRRASAVRSQRPAQQNNVVRNQRPVQQNDNDVQNASTSSTSSSAISNNVQERVECIMCLDSTSELIKPNTMTKTPCCKKPICTKCWAAWTRTNKVCLHCTQSSNS